MIFGMKARRPRPLDDGAKLNLASPPLSGGADRIIPKMLNSHKFALASLVNRIYDWYNKSSSVKEAKTWAGSSAVEQEPFKLLVTGSNPVRLTLERKLE